MPELLQIIIAHNILRCKKEGEKCMSNKEKLIQLINTLNESGIESLVSLLEGIGKNEKHNINTSPERLEEINKIEKQQEEEKKAKYEEKREREALYYARKEHERIKKYIASLSDKDKEFLDKINSVRLGNYGMSVNDMMLIANIYNNNLINGADIIYKYGFLKGQRSEKNRRRRVKNELSKVQD